MGWQRCPFKWVFSVNWRGRCTRGILSNRSLISLPMARQWLSTPSIWWHVLISNTWPWRTDYFCEDSTEKRIDIHSTFPCTIVWRIVSSSFTPIWRVYELRCPYLCRLFRTRSNVRLVAKNWAHSMSIEPIADLSSDQVPVIDTIND